MTDEILEEAQALTVARRRELGLDDDGNDPDAPVPVGRDNLVDWAAERAEVRRAELRLVGDDDSAESAGAPDIPADIPPGPVADVTDVDRTALWRRTVPPGPDEWFWRVTIDHLDGDTRALADEWVDDTARNVVLLGDLGAGKTSVAIACARWAFDRGAGVKFWPAPELLEALRPGRSDDDVLARTIGADVLVLDDMGAENPSRWVSERLYMVINRRWLENRPVLATSNLPLRPDPADPDIPTFEDAIGSRVYSRLQHGALGLVLAGDDRRRQDTT